MHVSYHQLISIENLFQAWNGFKKGKSKKHDIQLFEYNLEDNLFELYRKLSTKTYRHGLYEDFYVHDPKRRHIHKATVSDRVIHHLLYEYLYKVFDKAFIFDSYSCRFAKGTHKGVHRLERFVRSVSRNYMSSCWALSCDIQKFFASVNHAILTQLLKKRIFDKDILWLLQEVIDSFHSGYGKGIPLGNLTSQIFANIYLNELDQFIKHRLKVKFYIRYADDFVIVSRNKEYLEKLILHIQEFLQMNLKLSLHRDKIIIRKLPHGIDFLGYIVLPYYILPRTKTRKRIFQKLKLKSEELRKGNMSEKSFNQSLQSYLGYLSHANVHSFSQELKNKIWFWLNEKSHTTFLLTGFIR